MVIRCKLCGKTAEGNPHIGRDILKVHFFPIISESFDEDWVIVCDDCKIKVNEKAEELMRFLKGVCKINLWYLTKEGMRQDEK